MNDQIFFILIKLIKILYSRNIEDYFRKINITFND